MLTRFFIAASIVLVAVGCSPSREISNSKLSPQTATVYVLVPPEYDANMSPGQNQCVFHEFLFPTSDFDPFRCGAELANDDSLLIVSAKDDRSITLNNEVNGSLDEPAPLVKRLSSLFQDRARSGVFEPGSNRVVKAVGLRVSQETSFGDFMKVARAVDESGADPIVLVLDGRLPNLKPLSAH